MGDTNRQRADQGDAREHLNDEVLNAYLDGATAGLSPVARSYADAHLARCAECRAALEDLDATLAMLRALPQVELRRSFILTPEAAAAVGGPRLPRRPFGWIWPARWATALAALIFAITVGLDVGGGSGTPPAPALGTAVATAAQATPTPCEPPGCLTSLVDPTSVIIYPTPTAAIQPAAHPGTSQAQVDWRPAQVLSGLIAILGGFIGFLLPNLLRRRNAAAA